MTPIAMEILEQPLFDTEDLRRIGQRVSLFVQPMGTTVMSIWRAPHVKDQWETNLVQCGQLEAPCEFQVRDITALLFDEDGPLPVFDRTGMGNLWAKSHLAFFISMKLWWQGPLYLLADPVCQIGGLPALLNFKDADPGETLKMLSYQRQHPLDLKIRQQESFSVQVTPYTPVCRPITVRVLLNGLRTRPVL